MALADCEQITNEIAAKEGLVFVHPYDDDKIMAGQGTIGLEMLADFPDLDTIVVPIGGGGLISGIATAAKALKPSIRIVGVETELYPSMHNVLKGGGPVERRAVDRGRHRGQECRREDARDLRAAGRRVVAGVGGVDRAGDCAFAFGREDGCRGRGCDGVCGAVAASGEVQRAQDRRRADRREHRSAVCLRT